MPGMASYQEKQYAYKAKSASNKSKPYHYIHCNGRHVHIVKSDKRKNPKNG